MSRSFKHLPITGTTTANSEKEDKRIHNRRLRRRANERLHHDPENYLEPIKHEVTNLWSMAKDGKRHWGGTDWADKARRK